MARRRESAIVGVNIGANKTSDDRIADYEKGAARFAPLADYLTVNISSPNTPGLRDLQALPQVTEIVSRVRKVAPDTPLWSKSRRIWIWMTRWPLLKWHWRKMSTV